MRGLAIFIGVVVIVVLLVTSGVIGGAFCLERVGCIATTEEGVSIDGSQEVTIQTGDGEPNGNLP